MIVADGPVGFCAEPLSVTFVLSTSPDVLQSRIQTSRLQTELQNALARVLSIPCSRVSSPTLTQEGQRVRATLTIRPAKSDDVPSPRVLGFWLTSLSKSNSSSQVLTVRMDWTAAMGGGRC